MAKALTDLGRHVAVCDGIGELNSLIDSMRDDHFLTNVIHVEEKDERSVNDMLDEYVKIRESAKFKNYDSDYDVKDFVKEILIDRSSYKKDKFIVIYEYYME